MRVYAHQVRPDRQPGERKDFAETLYWNAGLKTDDQGTATVEFALSDSVTSFRVAADAFDEAGALGSGTRKSSRSSRSTWNPSCRWKSPASDYILLPVSLANAEQRSPLGRRPTSPQVDKLALDRLGEHDCRRPTPACGGSWRSPSATIHRPDGRHALGHGRRVSPTRVTRSLNVQPIGFPIVRAQGGLWSRETPMRIHDRSPRGARPRQPDGKAEVYPTPLASMTGPGATDSGSQRLLRADQQHDLSAGDGPAVLHEAPGSRSVADSQSDEAWRAATSGWSASSARGAATSGSGRTRATTR